MEQLELERRTLIGAAWAAPIIIAAAATPALAASGGLVVALEVNPLGMSWSALSFRVTITGTYPEPDPNRFVTTYTWSISDDPTVMPISGLRNNPRAEGPTWILYLPAENNTGAPIDGVLTVTAYGVTQTLAYRHPAR